MSDTSMLAVRRIRLRGFKSYRDWQQAELRPLTVLAGANSSGKSSFMQPLLLLKQTLEARFDPGPLKLDGPNVAFSHCDQLLWRGIGKKETARSFEIELELEDARSGIMEFERDSPSFKVASTTYAMAGRRVTLTPHMRAQQAERDLLAMIPSELSNQWRITPRTGALSIQRRGFLLELARSAHNVIAWPFSLPGWSPAYELHRTLHLPGLRGNPARTYRVAGVQHLSPGLFQDYVASILMELDATSRGDLESALQDLGLTWKVDVRQLDANNLEIRVGRMPHSQRGGAHDLVNIADAGFGLSQSLPILVALVIAKPRQLVFIEQPEIHLHPRAQIGLARMIVSAVANRGAQVVIETHSALLILALQRLVAERLLDKDSIVLHWFQRDRGGATRITTAHLDDAGAFGDWPADFADVELSLHAAYHEAAWDRLPRQTGSEANR